MSEISRDNRPPQEPVKKDELQPPPHGDKLEDAVVRVARATKPPRDPKDLRGDDIME